MRKSNGRNDHYDPINNTATNHIFPLSFQGSFTSSGYLPSLPMAVYKECPVQRSTMQEEDQKYEQII